MLIVEPSNSVTLHAYQLNITQAAMRWEGTCCARARCIVKALTFASPLLADGSVMPAMVISYSEESKTATIQFPHTLQAGRHLPPLE